MVYALWRKRKIEISVIIPAYNVQAYLKRCLDSLCKQTFDDFELLLIDDGSTDQTFFTAQTFLCKFKNFKIYKRPNSGVSNSRNFGIKHAKGKYLFFLDADDSIEADTLELIHKKISLTNSDSIFVDYNIVDETRKTVQKRKLHFFEEQFPDKTVTGREALLLLFKMKISHWSWEVVAKRSVYIGNSVFFPSEQRYGEDFRTTYKLLYFSDNVSFIKKKLYNYTQRSGSAMHTPKASDSFDYLETIADIDKFIFLHDKKLLKQSAFYEIPRLINAYSILCKFQNKKNYSSQLRFIKKLLIRKILSSTGKWHLSGRDKLKAVLICLGVLPILYRMKFTG